MTDQWLPYPLPAGVGRTAFAVTPRRPPGSVRGAVVVMLMRAAIALGSLVATSLTTNELHKRLAVRFPSLTGAQVDLAVDIGLAVALTVGAAWIVGYALLAARVRRGGNTARVLSIGWSWLAILGDFFIAAHTTSAILGTIAVVDAMMNVAVITLLTVTESWDYSNRYRMV